MLTQVTSCFCQVRALRPLHHIRVKSRCRKRSRSAIFHRMYMCCQQSEKEESNDCISVPTRHAPTTNSINSSISSRSSSNSNSICLLRRRDPLEADVEAVHRQLINNMMSPSSSNLSSLPGELVIPAPQARLIREGWLQKRGMSSYLLLTDPSGSLETSVYLTRPDPFCHVTGEHIKNWRQRYFVLREDGTLIGFKTKPEPNTVSEPLNNFTVKGCQVLKCEKPKPFTFMLRGLQWTTVIERTFATDNGRERDEWCQAIEHVASLLQAAEEDVEMLEEPSGDSKGVKIHVGSSSSSRGRKITLDDFEFIKVLGKGTFGKVILCREKATQLLYAIKVLKKEVIIAKDEVAHTLTENRVLRNTNHPFLIVSILVVEFEVFPRPFVPDAGISPYDPKKERGCDVNREKMSDIQFMGTACFCFRIQPPVE